MGQAFGAHLSSRPPAKQQEGERRRGGELVVMHAKSGPAGVGDMCQEATAPAGTDCGQGRPGARRFAAAPTRKRPLPCHGVHKHGAGDPPPGAVAASCWLQLGRLQPQRKGWLQQRQRRGRWGRQRGRPPLPPLRQRSSLQLSRGLPPMSFGGAASDATRPGSQGQLWAPLPRCRPHPPAGVPSPPQAEPQLCGRSLLEARHQCEPCPPAGQWVGSYVQLRMQPAPAASAERRCWPGMEGVRSWRGGAELAGETRGRPAARAAPGCGAPGAGRDGSARLQRANGSEGGRVASH